MTAKIISMVILVFMLVFVSAICLVAGQKGRPNNAKKMWSPPDGSFAVELPLKLEELKGEYEDLSHETYKSIKLFGSAEADASNGAFEVVILDLSEKGKLNVQGKLKGLEFLIGGDDKKPTKATFVKIDGLPAKEVLFISPNKCSKGLMIDAGDRIYVLGLVVNDCKDLNSTVAKRFFKTFHLVRHG